MREAAVAVLVAAGVAVQVLAVAGVALMREPLDRLHYAGASTVAAVCVGAGVLVRDSFSLIGIKALLLAAFLLVSSPVLVHATGRAIHLRAARDDA
jgi:multisubunit Na+/H+ antiporter MnhG subunit